MFTGIIEETGKIDAIRKGGDTYKIRISCSKVLGKDKASDIGEEVPEIPTRIGDSIAVNGICLTVTEIGNGTFTADVMPETVNRTSLSDAKAGTRVNLERAMPAYGRFGGHIVSGHIDGTGDIVSIRKDGNAVWYEIHAEQDVMTLIVEKGSVAVDGISLTVAEVGPTSFKVSVIPHTIEETILPDKKCGSKVNLETDIIGKYTKKLIESEKQGQSLSDKALYELL